MIKEHDSQEGSGTPPAPCWERQGQIGALSR